MDKCSRSNKYSKKFKMGVTKVADLRRLFLSPFHGKRRAPLCPTLLVLIFLRKQSLKKKKKKIFPYSSLRFSGEWTHMSAALWNKDTWKPSFLTDVSLCYDISRTFCELTAIGDRGWWEVTNHVNKFHLEKDVTLNTFSCNWFRVYRKALLSYHKTIISKPMERLSRQLLQKFDF